MRENQFWYYSNYIFTGFMSLSLNTLLFSGQDEKSLMTFIKWVTDVSVDGTTIIVLVVLTSVIIGYVSYLMGEIIYFYINKSVNRISFLRRKTPKKMCIISMFASQIRREINNYDEEMEEKEKKTLNNYIYNARIIRTIYTGIILLQLKSGMLLEYCVRNLGLFVVIVAYLLLINSKIKMLMNNA